LVVGQVINAQRCLQYQMQREHIMSQMLDDDIGSAASVDINIQCSATFTVSAEGNDNKKKNDDEIISN
jgi:hypothetical protein